MKNGKARVFWLAGTVLAAVLVCLAPVAGAADVSVGIGVGAAPEYEGSEDYVAVPLPYLNVGFSNNMSVNLLVNKAKVNLIPSAMWKAGVVGEYIPERDDVENDVVDTMKPVDASFMVGGFAGVEYGDWSASVEAMQDAADGNDGAIVRLNGGYKIPIDQTWSLNLGVFTTYADDTYMEAYFSVSPADSARSGLPVYEAEAGFKDVGASVLVTYKVGENWGLKGLASYRALLGDAADSPIVDDEGDTNQINAGILAYYSF